MPTTKEAFYVAEYGDRKELFRSYKDALGFLRDNNIDNWEIYREETIKTPVASSEEQNEY